MKYYRTFVLSLISSTLSTVAFADTRDPQLNNIDAAQQQRQKQYQQAQADKLQTQPDIRLDSPHSESLLLSSAESPCYTFIKLL